MCTNLWTLPGGVRRTFCGPARGDVGRARLVSPTGGVRVAGEAKRKAPRHVPEGPSSVRFTAVRCRHLDGWLEPAHEAMTWPEVPRPCG
jgi:hypothetical protein